MVGYLRNPTIEEEPPEFAKPDDLPPVDFSVSAFDDFSLSFADSLLDFDWIEGPQVLDMADSRAGLEKLDSETTEVGAVAGGMGIDKSCRETTRGDKHADGFQKLGNSGSLIEEEIRKVSLEGESDGLAVADANGGESPADGIGPMSGATGISGKSAEIVAMNENGANSVEMVSAETITINGDGPKINETESDGDESDSTSESDSTPSSSSSSSSSEEEDDEDEEEEEAGTEEQENLNEELEVEGEIDREEGEIRESDVEKMVAWSGDEDDEEDGSGIKGPIRSKNELEALPFVPPVNVTLQPHHQTLPVGVILSTIGAQVIVEGVENHSPLSEGSILWITESRTPLGLVDEIFGPVKSPYYIIRYNSENEVPAGVKQGTLISFVPEFANHVLNDRNLYKKGYDASGENDEEISDEAEFSDDEKEAEYKRMLKMTKRGTNDPTLGKAKMDKKKFKSRGGTWQNNQPSTSQPVKGVHQIPTYQNQHRASPHAISMDRGNSSHSFGTSQGFAGNPQMVQAPGFIPPSSVVWTNGMPCEQQQRMVFPSGVPPNGIPWPHPNFHQQSYQMPMPNIMPFQQQFLPNQIGPSNVVALPGAQSNISAGPAFGPWAGSLGQSGYNQPFGMGLQCQQAPMSMNAPNVGASTQQPFGMGMQCQQPPMSMNACNAGAPTHPVIPSSTEVPQGSYRGCGRKPYHRGGGGRFGGGRGRGRQS